ncbi:MAG: beta-ketoacyl-ACP synthase III, partial [Cellvibrionales bacterium]|nr:beta-ketoacyl-ACP synthase III [Cellvibrionales bacterium]
NNEELVGAFNQHIDQQADDNEDKSKLYSSEAFIVKASGIENRHVINKSGILNPNRMRPELTERPNDQLSIQAEMAVVAAEKALIKADLKPEDIDSIIVACSNLQRAYPAIAIEVQQQLGIEGFAYDMNVACSSATFGVANAVASIQSGQAKRVLVINPEICSGHLDFTDRDCHFIFGDAATALVIESEATAPANHGFAILDTKLTTQFSNNIRNNAGFLNRTSEDTQFARDKLFMQNGRKVFKEVCPMAAEHISTQITDNQMTVGDVKKLWLHQANLSMNQLIAKKVLGREASEGEAPIILNEYANTSSAGSIIAFHLHHEDCQEGDIGVICSFGAGYSIGSLLVQKR